MCELIKITHARCRIRNENGWGLIVTLVGSFKVRFYQSGEEQNAKEIKRKYPLNISFGIHLSSEIALLSQTAI